MAEWNQVSPLGSSTRSYSLTHTCHGWVEVGLFACLMRVLGTGRQDGASHESWEDTA